MQENPRQENGAMNIPDDAIERLARFLFPRMLAYFSSEEGQHEPASENDSTTAAFSDAAPCSA